MQNQDDTEPSDPPDNSADSSFLVSKEDNNSYHWYWDDDFAFKEDEMIPLEWQGALGMSTSANIPKFQA